MKYIYAYCHGFLSNPQSAKGVFLKKELEAIYGKENDFELHLLNINGGDDCTLITRSHGFCAINQLWEKEHENAKLRNEEFKLRLIGSSYGGQLIAFYAEAFPDRVDSLVMLCPAINIYQIIRTIVVSKNPQGLDIWRKQGYINWIWKEKPPGEFKLPLSFLEDIEKHDGVPKYRCRSMIIQGDSDCIVKPEVVDDFLLKNTEQALVTTLHIVHDDHALSKPDVLEYIKKNMIQFFGLSRSFQEKAKKTKQIEVELQYQHTEDIEKVIQQLETLRFYKVVETRHTDVYYEFDNMQSPSQITYPLTRNGNWLRLRGGKLELKTKCQNKSGSTSIYEEKDDVLEIVSELIGKYQDIIGKKESITKEISSFAAQEIPGLLGLTPFATYTLHRKRYKQSGAGNNGEDCNISSTTIDIDVCSFGHQMVEIERMVTILEGDDNSITDRRIALASKSIGQIAASLGLDSSKCGDRFGKISNYLKTHRPLHYEVFEATP